VLISITTQRHPQPHYETAGGVRKEPEQPSRSAIGACSHGRSAL